MNQNEENQSNMNASTLVGGIDYDPKITRVKNDFLYESIEKLIQDNASILKGEYSFYCVYQKTDESQEKYALIHSFYLEESGIKFDDVKDAIKEDYKLMDSKLKESNLDCDYFFVLPYYDFIDRSKGSRLINDKIKTGN